MGVGGAPHVVLLRWGKGGVQGMDRKRLQIVELPCFLRFGGIFCSKCLKEYFIIYLTIITIPNSPVACSMLTAPQLGTEEQTTVQQLFMAPGSL